jgi:protein TonB
MDEIHDDITGGEAGATGVPAAPRSRRRDVVRIGPLTIPAAVAAWTVSLSAHAVVLLVGLASLRQLDRPPVTSFAQGDGGTATGVYREGGAGDPVREVDPPSPVATPPGAHPTAIEPEEPDPTDAFAPPARPLSLEGDEQPGEAGFIGVGPSTIDVPPRGSAAGRRGHAAGTGSATPNSHADGGDGGGGSAAGPGNEGTPGIAGGAAGAKLPAPVYPRESRLRGEEGTVVVEVEVNPDGSVASVRIIDDSGYPRLATSAVAAAKQAQFLPAIVNGHAVASTVRIPFRFRLRAR